MLPEYRLDSFGKLLTYHDWVLGVAKGVIPWPPPLPEGKVPVTVYKRGIQVWKSSSELTPDEVKLHPLGKTALEIRSA
jgi:hypothetical protein